ncbi:MAG TPA: tetratricopeptide repeat protein [Alloacidobacterium sp.]|nr:tetratricopeptide repeat protein [Alloacidobacterium sp.]
MTVAKPRFLCCGLILIFTSIVSFSQAENKTQQEIQLHSQKAHAYLQEKRPDLAIPEFQSIVSLDPQNADAQGNLGVLLFFRGDAAGAVPHLSAAVQQQPTLWKIRALLGLAEMHMKNTTAGQRDLEAAFPQLTEEKFKNDVGLALIDSYSATGELEKAATVTSTLLAAQPTNVSLLYTAYRLYSDLAEKTMLTMALAAPDSAQMHQIMARELARHDDQAAAIANYREALRINPNLSDADFELGELLYNSTEDALRSQAEAEFKASLAKNPANAKAMLMLGIIASKREDTKTAYDYESRAYELQPDDSDIDLELAKLLVSMNQNQKAEQLLKHAIEIDPTNYVAHYRLAALYRRQGNTEAANQEIDAYKKYKSMKDKLEKIFHDMRVESTRSHPDDADPPK